MRIKVSNYISRKLVESGIVRGFSVVGGGAMHLNMRWDMKRDSRLPTIITSRLVRLRRSATRASTISPLWSV